MCVCAKGKRASLSFIQSSDHINQRDMNGSDDSVYGLCFSGDCAFTPDAARASRPFHTASVSDAEAVRMQSRSSARPLPFHTGS